MEHVLFFKNHTDAIQFFLGLNYFIPGPIQDVAQVQCRAWLFCWMKTKAGGLDFSRMQVATVYYTACSMLVEHTSMEQTYEQM